MLSGTEMQRLTAQGPVPRLEGMSDKERGIVGAVMGGQGDPVGIQASSPQLPWHPSSTGCWLHGLGHVPYLCLFPMVKRRVSNDGMYLLGLCGE